MAEELREKESALLQQLEAVRTALAQMGEPAHLSPKESVWSDLTVAQREAAGYLGYHQESWDAGDLPAGCAHAWEALSARDRAAAERLGYDQASWSALLLQDSVEPPSATAGTAAPVLERLLDQPSIAEHVAGSDPPSPSAANSASIRLSESSDGERPERISDSEPVWLKEAGKLVSSDIISPQASRWADYDEDAEADENSAHQSHEGSDRRLSREQGSRDRDITGRGKGKGSKGGGDFEQGGQGGKGRAGRGTDYQRGEKGSSRVRGQQGGFGAGFGNVDYEDGGRRMSTKPRQAADGSGRLLTPVLSQPTGKGTPGKGKSVAERGASRPQRETPKQAIARRIERERQEAEAAANKGDAPEQACANGETESNDAAKQAELPAGIDPHTMCMNCNTEALTEILSNYPTAAFARKACRADIASRYVHVKLVPCQ
ncbi:MAG: hypothetical protein SGPRY_010286 [Prymnesium sp.]